MWARSLWSLPAGPVLICRDGPVFRLDEMERLDGGTGAVSARPTVAVWKFSSCDGTS